MTAASCVQTLEGTPVAEIFYNFSLQKHFKQYLSLLIAVSEKTHTSYFKSIRKNCAVTYNSKLTPKAA